MTGKSLLFLILTLFLQHNILFSAETLDEQGFLFQALEQAYDVKIIKTSISSAVQKYLKTKEIYSPKATLGGNYLQQANDTNNPANKILEMKNLSLKTGLSKMFVTGTVLGIGAEASYSDSHFQTVTYITNATNVVSYPIANPTYQPNPLIAGYDPHQYRILFITNVPYATPTNVMTNTYSFIPKISFNIVQPILKNGLAGLPGIAQVKIHKNMRDFSDLGQQMLLSGFILNSLQQYHMLVINLKVYKLYSEMLLSVKDLFDKYKQRYDAGLISESDLLMFEKKYLEYMLRTEQSGKTLEDIIMNIKSVSKINISPDNNFNNINIIETFILQNKNYNIESLTNEAFRKNIDLLQAKIIIENNNLSYRMIKNSMLPELNLNTSFVLKGFTGKSRPSEWREAFQGISKSPDDYYEFFAGFDFSMPFLLPADRAKKMEIQYEKEKAEFDYLSRKETIHNELISILKNIDLLKKNIEASKRMEEIDEKRYKFAQTDYDNGNMDAENFSKIQDAYRFTQINRINLELQHISALLSLELKTGTLLETYGIDTSKFFKKG